MTHHGQLYLRDIVPPRSKYYNRGRFGRLFPTLPPFAADSTPVRTALMELGKLGRDHGSRRGSKSGQS